MSSAKSGGSFFKDVQNLAVPFGLLLAAHGVGYVSNKMSGKSSKKQSGGALKSEGKPKKSKGVAKRSTSEKKGSK